MKTLLFITLIFCIPIYSYSQDSTNLVSKTFQLADISPQYPGGEEALTKFIRTNTNYQNKKDKKGNLEMALIVFTVHEDGSLSNIEVVKPTSEYYNTEAVRLVKLMPSWVPGMTDGKNVKVRMMIPIRF